MKNKILDKKYNPKEIEENLYQQWKDLDLFSPPKKGKPFSIILPPPNVTGVLHLGHAWDTSIQDTIIRFKRLQGFRTLWVPGTDHAGIATQTKFEKYLKEEENITKDDLGREKFLKRLMIWKQVQVNAIYFQWSKLGLMLDYNSEKFTMDQDINKAVNKVFVDLYNNKLIYKGKKIINWDIKLQSAISDIEVIHKTKITKMYYFKYFLDKKLKKHIIIATTRPETMFGDVAVFVNPNDKKYKKLIGLKVLNPANKKWIPILADKYIDINFGSGAMKCTPAHDFNDYELAIKHKLDFINIMNKDGTMNELCYEYAKMDRIICRKKLVENLKNKNFIFKIDDNYETQIGYSERTDEIIEPYLSEQWFIKVKPLANKVLNNQKKKSKNTVDFLPKRFDKTLERWLENINDWCISRQLWWGHQIPAWYNKQTGEIYVGENEPKPNKDWERDNDVLDTWFSSSLWPFVTLNWPKETVKFKTFFPTSILVTGYDILFFWVSRMMMLSSYFTAKLPFEKVYIHGLMRDEKGIKMSKSLGNGIDPLDIIDEYGSDSLRLFLTSSSTIGEDLNFSKSKLSSNWNYLNKIWNSARFIMLNSENNHNTTLKLNNLPNICLWILNKLNTTIVKVTKNMNDYNFVVSSKILNNFIWNDFCNTFIELSKTDLLNKINSEAVISTTLYVFKNILIMLHPQCPFITEKLYLMLSNSKVSIIKEKWPEKIIIKKENEISDLVSIIEAIRRIRSSNDINFKQHISINILTNTKIEKITKKIKTYNNYLLALNAEIKNVSNISMVENKITEVLENFIIEVPTMNLVDPQDEIQKMVLLVEKIEFEIKRSKDILKNNDFISKAPKAKVDLEKEKLLKYKKQLQNLQESIDSLKLSKGH